MSSDQQEDSPTRQRNDIKALASRAGYKIVRWYEDHGITGTESANRPEFQRLLADARNGAFRAVLLSEQSRMSREDIFDVMVHWRRFRDANVKLVTCQRGELNFNDLGGVITAIVDQYGAREESLKLADRVVSGKRLAVQNGQKQGGIPFGYDREILDEAGRVVRRVTAMESFRRPPNWTSRLVIASDERAVEAVRFMFESAAAGLSWGGIARDLNRRGYTTLFGKRFNGTSVKRIVSNPVYAGDAVIGRTRRRGKFSSLYDEGGVVCESAHEPLVSRAIFEQVQLRIGERQLPNVGSPGRYLLTGLVYLASNGERLQGQTQRYNGKCPPRRYYALPSRAFEEFPDESNRPSFRADVIEEGVLAKLRDFLTDPRVRKSVQQEIGRRNKKITTNVASLENKLSEVRARIERATENLALADPADIPGISGLLSRWREEARELHERLRQTKGQDSPTAEALAIIARYDELLAGLSDANREKLAFAIRQTVKRITLRCEIREESYYRIVLWDGVIELRDEIRPATTLLLTDDDIPGPGRWREVANFIRQRADVVFFREACEYLGIKGSCVSRLLAQAVLSGKIRNLGHQKGWIANT